MRGILINLNKDITVLVTTAAATRGLQPLQEPECPHEFPGQPPAARGAAPLHTLCLQAAQAGAGQEAGAGGVRQSVADPQGQQEVGSRQKP